MYNIGNKQNILSAVVCSTNLPTSPNDTESAFNNKEALMLNSSYWNTFNQSVTYSCPEGHVLERPNMFDEQVTKFFMFGRTLLLS